MTALIVSIKCCAGGPKQHSKIDRQKQTNKYIRDEETTVFVCRCDYVHRCLEEFTDKLYKLVSLAGC